MSGKCFVDTNILVYAHDFGTGAKHQRARTLVENLWRSEGGVLSTEVLQELCIHLRRKSTRPLSVYKISFWDALILQAAGSSGATVLYSEDLAEGQTYGSVRVVNPLR
jgi:predicted nucleic acid-binding protein